MKLNLLSLLVLIFCRDVFAAERIVSSSISEVRDYVLKKQAHIGSENILVVFDFDNTLMAMNNDLGSDQWYVWQSDVIKKGDKKQAMVKDRTELFALHYKLFALGDMHPVEKETADVVKKIQELEIRTLILTSRGSEFRTDTEMELKRGGMDFSLNSPGPQGGYVLPYLPEGIENARPVSYQNGIFMGSGQHKGLLLKELLKKTGGSFKSIIVVDDTLKNIENIEAVYKEDKSVALFYYTREEARVKRFENDKSRAWNEWKTLKPVLRLYEKTNSAFTK